MLLVTIFNVYAYIKSFTRYKSAQQKKKTRYKIITRNGVGIQSFGNQFQTSFEIMK